jgi:hypothetical protein
LHGHADGQSLRAYPESTDPLKGLLDGALDGCPQAGAVNGPDPAAPDVEGARGRYPDWTFWRDGRDRLARLARLAVGNLLETGHLSGWGGRAASDASSPACMIRIYGDRSVNFSHLM